MDIPYIPTMNRINSYNFAESPLTLECSGILEKIEVTNANIPLVYVTFLVYQESQEVDTPGLENGMENNLDTGLPQEKLEPENPPAEGPMIQPVKRAPYGVRK